MAPLKLVTAGPLRERDALLREGEALWLELRARLDARSDESPYGEGGEQRWARDVYSHFNIGGGVSIDFTAAALDPSGGRLIAVTAAGGTEITVPQEWDVHVTAQARTEAGIDRTRGAGMPAPDAPQLEIEVLNVAGSTVVKRPDRSEDTPGVVLFSAGTGNAGG